MNVTGAGSPWKGWSGLLSRYLRRQKGEAYQFRREKIFPAISEDDEKVPGQEKEKGGGTVPGGGSSLDRLRLSFPGGAYPV